MKSSFVRRRRVKRNAVETNVIDLAVSVRQRSPLALKCHSAFLRHKPPPDQELTAGDEVGAFFFHHRGTVGPSLRRRPIRRRRPSPPPNRNPCTRAPGHGVRLLPRAGDGNRESGPDGLNQPRGQNERISSHQRELSVQRFYDDQTIEDVRDRIQSVAFQNRLRQKGAKPIVLRLLEPLEQWKEPLRGQRLSARQN